MAIAREDLSSLLEGAFHAPTEFYQSAVRLHKKWYWAGISLLMLLITLYVVMSYAGHPEVIAIINFVLIPILGFYISAPATFLAMFGLGVIKQTSSYNWEWRNLFRDDAFVIPDIEIKRIGEEGFNTYVSALKIPAHVLILTIAAGTILELIRVKYPLYALMFFPIIAAIGLWTIVHKSEAKWYRRITFVILFVGAVASFYKTFVNETIDPVAFIREIPSYVTRGEEDWVPVSMVTKCTPTWNEKQGWCDLGTFPVGTYRVVPQFDTWQMGLAPSNPPKATDQESYPMSAEGLDVKVYLADNEKISDFFKTAFVKSYRYGGLIMKVGTSLPIEVIGNDGLPRELVLEKETRISINVNLPKLPERFSTNRGTLTVEVQKLSP